MDSFAEKYQPVIERALVECAEIVTRIFSDPAFQDLITDADTLLSVLNYATVTPDSDMLAHTLFANEAIKSLLVTPAQIEQAREYAPHAVDSFFDLPLAPEPAPAPARAPAVFEVSATAADVVVSSSGLWHRRAGSDASASPSDEGYAPLAGSAKEAAAKASAKKKSSSGCCPNRCATM